MAARDIRRQSPTASPNNYISEGVQDNSLAIAAEGVAKAGFALDAGLAKERFGDAVETLRSEYMAGGAIGAELQDEAAAGTGDDVDVGFQLTGQDKSSLKDFQEVLTANDRAVEQGRMSRDMFRLRAERLYRIAISKRPGLAGEFRQVATNLLGMDVVGASLDIMAESEAAALRDAASAAKSKRDLQIDNEKDRLSRLEKANIPIPANVRLGDGSVDQFWNEAHEAYALTVKNAAAVKFAEDQVKVDEATKKTNIGSQTAAWMARAGAVRGSVWNGAERILQNLKSAGAEQDAPSVRQALEQGLTALDKEVAVLEAGAAGGTVDPAAVSRTMGIINEQREQLRSFLDGSDDKTLVENYQSVIQGQKSLALMSDDEFLTASAISKAFPDSVSGLMFQKLDKTMTLMAGRMLLDNSEPDAVMRYAQDITGGAIASVFPRGKTTPPDPQAVAGLVQLLGKGAESFTYGNDAAFRLENYLGSVAKQGFVSTLNSQLKTLDAHLSPEQKEELGSSLILATANAVRVTGLGLVQETPSLKGKWTVDFSPDDARVYKARPGVKLTVPEQQALAKYNRAMNVDLLNKVIGTLTGKKSPEVWQTILQTYQPVLKARKSRSKAGAGGRSMGGSGSEASATTELTGPSTRWWD